jgi:uncharacterized protein YeaO (DUF488 family)
MLRSRVSTRRSAEAEADAGMSEPCVQRRPTRGAEVGPMEDAMIKLKRVYDPVSRTDGTRFLVERLWPRGLSKATLQLTAWLKEVGPSTELRQWFKHDPLKWPQFRSRYFRELDSQPESWQPILTAARRGMVTLVYSSHDEEHNNAVALNEYLQAKRHRPSPRRRSATAHPSRADR